MESVESLIIEMEIETSGILSRTEGANNPLATILRAALIEQRKALSNLHSFFDEGTPKATELKKPLFILYHDDGISESTYRAWKRGLTWKKENGLFPLEEIEGSFQTIKQCLQQLAVELKNWFPTDELRYIVPVFYVTDQTKE